MAAGTGAVSLATAFAADKIKVGILPFTSHAPDIIAAGKGYFAAQGIDARFVLFEAAQPMAVAIASGDVDFGVTAITGGLISLAEKGAVKVIGGALEETPDVEGEKILVSKKAYDAGSPRPAKLTGHTSASPRRLLVPLHGAQDRAEGGLRHSAITLGRCRRCRLSSPRSKAARSTPGRSCRTSPNADARARALSQIGQIADYIPNYQVTTCSPRPRTSTSKGTW